MKDILEEIVAHKRMEVERMKQLLSEREIHRQVEAIIDSTPAPPSMSKALRSSETGIIAEFKRKSPSKGWIKEEGQPDIIPLSYEQNGAAAVSILTDEHFFGGADSFMLKAKESGLNIPMLYKNFVIDEYQLFQARLCGASAVLLEMHSEAETEYADVVDLQRDMCGINNRNLGTFITDVQNSFRLAARLPKDACCVSESGISNPDTVKTLRLAGFNGFLIGENFMKSESPGKALGEFIEALR